MAEWLPWPAINPVSIDERMFFVVWIPGGEVGLYCMECRHLVARSADTNAARAHSCPTLH